jgi:hypothetical protein
LAVLIGVVGYWSHTGYGAIATILPAVLGTSLLVIGTQTALGGFLLAVIGGNEAAFLTRSEAANHHDGASRTSSTNARRDRAA